MHRKWQKKKKKEKVLGGPCILHAVFLMITCCIAIVQYETQQIDIGIINRAHSDFTSFTYICIIAVKSGNHSCILHFKNFISKMLYI